ncbi:MAG TPA: c-type cytochrome [Nitrospirales bacterium]|jgi:DMSO reductase family type II enzyme heme b subunit
MNALFTHITRKSLVFIIVATGLGIAAGAAILSATGDVTAAEGLTPGFIKGGTPVKPDPGMVEAGKKIYFRKCVWCHGVDGAGDGPGADRLWPRPRNFNQGTFKIRHTASGELPLFDSHSTDKNDLFQTVTHGLPGSAMPSWDGILTEQQRLQVLSFVTTQLVKDRKFDDKTETFTILDIKNDSAVKPIKYSKESLEKGKQLIVDKKCVECHGNEGRGDGNPFNLKDDWGFPIQPANWHKCWNFRGSRQDPYNIQNIFRTFSTGVNGTPMPSFADNTTLEERWHIANFVNSLCEREKQDDPFSDPLPIDPQTDKPKINFVVPSAPIEGEIPADPNDKKWKEQPRRLIGMGGQITHKPRNFVNRIDDMWVRSIYNKNEIAFMFQWDDRTKSEAAAGIAGTPIAEAPPKTGEADSIAAKQNSYEVYNDGVAIQFPAKWEEITPPEKPRYLHGEEKRHVDIWKWEANGTVKAYTGAGWDQPLEERPDSTATLKLLKGEFKEGRWTVIFKRPLTTEDKDADVQFQVGKYIPTVFFAWDGHNGDAGLKMAVSAFYYSILQQPLSVEAKVYPILMAVGMIIAEGWILRRRASKRRTPQV